MAKRFIDTALFDDHWYSELSKDGKLAWLYYITKCDHAGIFRIAKKTAEFQTGIKSWGTVTEELGNRLIRLEDDKYFIPKFILYQYPKGLSDNVTAQKSAKDILLKYNLFDNSSGTVRKDLSNSCQTVVDIYMDTNMDKDKYMDKDTECEETKILFIDVVKLSQCEFMKLEEEYGKDKTKAMIEKLNNWFMADIKKLKKYTSHYHCIKNWVSDWYDKEYKTVGKRKQSIQDEVRSLLPDNYQEVV